MDYKKQFLTVSSELESAKERITELELELK
jgi:hypothetical protein